MAQCSWCDDNEETPGLAVEITTPYHPVRVLGICKPCVGRLLGRPLYETEQEVVAKNSYGWTWRTFRTEG